MILELRISPNTVRNGSQTLYIGLSPDILNLTQSTDSFLSLFDVVLVMLPKVELKEVKTYII